MRPESEVRNMLRAAGERRFEPSVPDERKPTRASVTFDRYRRHSGRFDTRARRPVAIAIRPIWLWVAPGTALTFNAHA